MNNDKKSKYRLLCETEKTIPFFSQAWWLDVVCANGEWDVALVESDNKIIAALPYFMENGNIGMPKLTQTMGPWIRESNAKYAKRLSNEKSLMESLISQLPPYKGFFQNFHYSITNWLPFYWNDFHQTTRYTYVIEELDDEDKLWSNMLENIRTDIKKASRKVLVKTDLSIEVFYEALNKTFSRKGMENPYSFELIKKIDEACANKNCAQKFFAVDPNGIIHCAIFIAWDAQSAYYLMSGSDPEYRNSGANSLLLWEGLKFCSPKVGKFDFEGSMIEPVERFVRAFGAKQFPYFTITRTNFSKGQLFFQKVTAKLQSML